MFQCVSDRVKVLLLKSTISGFEEMGPAEVKRRYGVEPELVPDFIALRGDPSDGLPGAPGIGPKTAADLLQRYGSLDEAIARAIRERPRVTAALTESADDLRAYREIAKLRHVELERPPDRPSDLAGGAGAARALGLNRLAERLENANDLSDL
jgi:DNA polymerase-1